MCLGLKKNAFTCLCCLSLWIVFHMTGKAVAFPSVTVWEKCLY